MPYLKAGELIKVLSAANGQPFSHRTLSNWIETGVITPVVEPGGQGNPRVFSITDTLAIACGRGMRGYGFSLKAAAAVMDVIKGFSEERLLAAFEEGRTHICFLGDHVFSRLITEKDARESSEGFEAEHPEVYRTTGLSPQAIDVHQVYLNILRVIEDGESAGKGQKPKVTA
jgi:hypothetical protein